MTEKIIVLTNENFDEFISNTNAIVDFYADWCGPCKMMAPHFEKAAEQNENVKFGKVNVDGNQELAVRFGVMSIPTTIVFKNKEQVDRHTGALSEEDINEMIKKNF